LQIKLSPHKRRIILASLLLVVIIFLGYLSLQSFLADVHYRKAKELSRNIEWKQAVAEYEKAISISPGNAEYHDEVGQIYSKLFALYQDDEWFDKAVYHFKESYRLNSYNAWAHYHLAWAYWSKTIYPAAAEESKMAIQLDPNNATYHWQLAAIYEKMGRLENALDEYEEVLRVMPNYAEAKEAIKKVEREIQSQGR